MLLLFFVFFSQSVRLSTLLFLILRLHCDLRLPHLPRLHNFPLSLLRFLHTAFQLHVHHRPVPLRIPSCGVVVVRIPPFVIRDFLPAVRQRRLPATATVTVTVTATATAITVVNSVR